ncbi:acyltransferase family protein [Methylobacterium sp. JK268]
MRSSGAPDRAGGRLAPAEPARGSLGSTALARLDLLQALRAAAAVMVVLHHLGHELGTLGLRGEGPAALPWWAGVDVFFVISGFIMVHATGPDYDRPGGRIRFLAHRVARVVPLYWLVTLAFLAVALAAPRTLGDAGAALSPGFVAASFLFWPAARPDGTLQPLYGLGWTLNYEMFFYVVFALGLGRGRVRTVAWIAGLFALLIGLGAAIRPLPAPLAFWSDPIVVEFLLGAALGLIHRGGGRLGRPVCVALGLGAVIGLASCGGGEVSGFARPLWAGVPAAMLVAASGLAERASAPRPVVALGDASYALYLVHPFALRAVREAATRLGLVPVLGGIGIGTLMLAGSIAAALLTYRLIERPLTRRLRATLDRDAPRHRAGAA